MIVFPKNSQMQQLSVARRDAVAAAFQRLVRADMEGRPTEPLVKEYRRLLSDLDPEEVQELQPANPVPPLIPVVVAGYEVIKAIGAYLRRP